MKAWGLGSFFSSLAIPVGLQKKLLSFLLQRAIGHFLEDDLDLEKLDIELSNGIVHLTDLKLSTRALNGFTAGTPLAVTQGHISSITATIPWRNLWNGQCVLEIDGIDVTLVPVQCDRTTSTDSQDDHILSSSIGLANDFLQAVDKEEVAIQETLLQTFQSHVTQSTHSGMPGDFNSRPTTRPPTSNQEFPSTSTSIPSSALGSEDSVSEGEGIQFVAKLIEKLMARIQIICKRTTIRLRHSSSLPLTKSHARRPHEEKLQYELEIRLPYIGYRDETPGWDQLATSMDASSIRSESVSGSTVLEESVMPSVIWQESPESSIKTIVFKGFSVWIKQKGDSGKPVAQSSLTSASVLDDTICEALGSQDNQSDSDTDIFSDAHENFSQSMVASQIAPRQPIFRSTSSATSNQQTSQECYAAEILSTLQHKNRIKVNIRKNATMTTGSSQAQAQTTTKSLLDIDFHLRTMLIALAPNQIAFILEILTLIDNASGVEAIQCQKKPPNIGRTVDTNINNRSRQDISTHRTNYSGVTAAEGERSLQEPRSDSIAEHSSPIYSHSSLSPNRQHPTDPIRTSQLKTEARHYDFDKSLETMDSKTVTPLSVASLESPRFLSGPSYTDARPTASTSSSAVPSIESSQTIKLKARISILQLFVLYDDPESQHHIPTEMSFYKNPTPEALRADHSKFEVDSMVLRYQQWVSPDACSGQKPTKSTKGQIDFTLNNFTVAEWIQAAPRPYDLSAWSPTSDDYRIPPRRQYIPIIEFDTDQDTLLQASPTSKFPTLHIPDRYLNERTLLLRAKKNKRQPELARSTLIPDVEPNVSEKETSGGTTKEVVRMRVLLNPKKDSSKSSMPSPDAATAMSPGGFTREVTIEVKPVQVHIDLFTLQRLEKCLLAIIGPGQTAQAGLENQVNGSSLKPQRAMEQQIIDDLDANQKNTKTKTRLRLRLNSVQLWVSVPDIGEVLEGKEETGPEYRSHYDMLSINVMKLVLTQASDGTRGSEAIEFGPGSSPESYAPKTKIDFVNSSVFIIPKFQITTRSPGALPLHYERPILSGYPQNLNLRAFTVLEDEENIHNTTDEEVELLQLKQRTIETSLLVINTQLPLVAVHLHKADLDNLQMRLNDLSTWLTIFSERLVAKMPSLSTPPSRLDQTNAQDGFVRPQHESLDIGNDGHNNFHETYNNDWRSSHEDPFRDDQSEHGTDRSTAYGEELRNQARDNPFTSSTDRNSHYYQYQPSLVKPTMASALIYVQTVEVILDYPTKATIFGDDGIKSYQINIGDTKVFAAAKYQGGNENYLYVDAEELEVYEVTAQKPKVLLLARTIPKNIKLKLPKPMLHLTSILSFDPEIKFKANDINLAFTGISWKFSIEQTAVDDIQDFFAEPENIIYYNPPQQRTRIAVSLSECCMDYKPLHIPSRFVLSFEKMKVFSTLVPESPTLKSKVQIYNMALLLIDHIQSIRTPHFPVIGSSSPGIDSKHYWRLLGFALVGQCPFFELKSIKSKNGQLPLYDLVITNNIFYLETCSDSFDTLMKLAAYMGDNGDMPIEKKKILERLAEAERAANRAKSNVVYQDVLASLDEDAFRKPGTDPEVGNAGTLDFTEGFFSVEQDDSDSDLFKAQMRDTPNVDGFHEVYADLLGDMSIDNGICEEASTRSLGKQAEKGNSSKSKHRSLSSAVHEADLQTGNQTQDFGISTQTNKRISQEKVRRSESTRPSGHMRMESEADGKVIILDSEYELTLVEDHFFIPILTEEEKAREEKYWKNK
ncbi:autophagy- protein 2 [Lobosporangium transversale]|nr:autophagy- protein 2 [Lobosporangium transversale]